LEGDEEGTRKLRALLMRYFDEGKYKDIRVSEIVVVAKEECGLEGVEGGVLKPVVTAMFKEIALGRRRRKARMERRVQRREERRREKEERRGEREEERRERREREAVIAERKKKVAEAAKARRAANAAAKKARAAAAADAPSPSSSTSSSPSSDEEEEADLSGAQKKAEAEEGREEAEEEKLPVSRAAMTAYLEEMLEGVSLEHTSTKMIMTSLRDHFELTSEEFTMVRGPAKEILSGIVTRVMSLSQLIAEEEGGKTMNLDTMMVEREGGREGGREGHTHEMFWV